ncbi:hypothetical protein ACIF9R_35505 [Streptomyces sp. NPDC086080]|uniref:hypothetical protein n=1 Tax=Streptomyces sp. NPDC086080 TaxID=3365748 RepID=UPI0037D20D78
MPEESYSRSILFAKYQNAELAKEAISLARAFADVKFLRTAKPGTTLPHDWSRYVAINNVLRHTLDGALLAYAFSPREDGTMRDWEEAGRLASRVEAFVVPSAAVECQVIEHEVDGREPAYLIAVSPIVSELMAVLMWALPTVLLHYEMLRHKPGEEHFRELMSMYGPGSRELEESDYIVGTRLVQRLDDCIDSYLRAWVTNGATEPWSIIPTGDRVLAEERVDASTTYAACTGFLLSHELHHIQGGHFLAADPDAALAPFLSDLPEETRREVEADCSAFTLLLNSLIVREAGEDRRPRIPNFKNLKKANPFSRTSLLPGKRRRQSQAHAQFLRACVHRATEAMLSFYAVMDLLAAMAGQDGQTAQAARFARVAERRGVVRSYVKWLLGRIEDDWGARVWHPEEAELWTGLDDHIEHLKQTIVPAWKSSGATFARPDER